MHLFFDCGDHENWTYLMSIVWLMTDNSSSLRILLDLRQLYQKIKINNQNIFIDFCDYLLRWAFSSSDKCSSLAFFDKIKFEGSSFSLSWWGKLPFWLLTSVNYNNDKDFTPAKVKISPFAFFSEEDAISTS